VDYKHKQCSTSVASGGPWCDGDPGFDPGLPRVVLILPPGLVACGGTRPSGVHDPSPVRCTGPAVGPAREVPLDLPVGRAGQVHWTRRQPVGPACQVH
jgi:hypothetical protein